MSATVQYKGNTIATIENTTKTLQTEGKYMEGNVVITDVSRAAPTLQAKSNIAPTTSSQTITPDSGYDGLSSVQIDAISPIRTPSSVTVSGATVTIPNGYYSSQVSKSVSTGTAGTPTATKGTVNNHSVSVTPRVTNTTGYITGGTKTGTAVSVSASELVSGTLSITDNGTADVTNYASVDVNVSGGGGGTVIKGTFTGTTVGALEINLGYSGTGYIRHLCIYPNLKTSPIQNNIVSPHFVLFIITETDDTVPNYNNNKATVWVVAFKSNSSNATVSGINSAGPSGNTYFYENTPATDGIPYVGNAIKIRSNTQLSVLINDGSLAARGFQSGIEYVYEAYYKE